MLHNPKINHLNAISKAHIPHAMHLNIHQMDSVFAKFNGANIKFMFNNKKQ